MTAFVKYGELRILEELFNNEEKALIFCGSVEMIADMVNELKYTFRDSYVSRLDGSVPIADRSTLIDEFNSYPGSGVLIYGAGRFGSWRSRWKSEVRVR